MNSSANALTWYVKKSLQNHRQKWFYGQAVPIISVFDHLPAFQLSKEKNASAVSLLELISLDETSTTDILANCQAGGLELLETDNYEIISYPDSIPLALSGLEVGLYFLKMSDGETTWYSEVFQFCEVEDYIKIEYWHRETFCHNEGEFVFDYPYKNKVYIDSDIGKPSYPYDETVKKNNGVNFPLHQTSYKQYKFTAILTEAVIDALRLIGLHDDVIITYGGRTYIVNEFLMTNPTWDDRGDLAEVVFEFRTNTVVNIHGRAVDTQAYEADPGSCLILDFDCVGLVDSASAEYAAFEYINTLGFAQALSEDDLIVKQTGSTLIVEKYNASAYVQQSVAAGDVVYSGNNDAYYRGAGSDVILAPQIAFYNIDTNLLSGSGLPGAIHAVYEIINDVAFLVGNYTYDQLVNDEIIFEPSTSATHLRMEVSSAPCGVFFTTEDYLIPEPTVILYPVEYLDDVAAGIGGVNPCELYRISRQNEYGIISPASNVLSFHLGTCDSYANDEDAGVGGVANGEIYQSATVNDYGVPSGGARVALLRTSGGVVTTFKGPFTSDALAAAGGVALYEPYIASVANIYGIPSGGGRVLIVRTT